MADVNILEPQLTAFLEGTRGPAQREIKKAARYVKAAAKRFVPVDEGNLRRSIETRDVARDEQGLYIEVGSILPYALRIEYGFVGVDSLGRRYNQAAQPYLRPAARAITGGSVRLTGVEAKDRAGFNDRRRRRVGGRTLKQDRAQLKRITGRR